MNNEHNLTPGAIAKLEEVQLQLSAAITTKHTSSQILHLQQAQERLTQVLNELVFRQLDF